MIINLDLIQVDEEHFMEEYPFSVGGNDLKLAMELIDGVEPYGLEEK